MNKKPSELLTFKSPDIKSMQHQIFVVDNTTENNSYALFWEMGSGKTFGEIQRFRWKCMKENRLLKTLVICPIIVMENWKREFIKFSNVPEASIQVVTGINPKSKAKKKISSSKYKIEQLKEKSKSIFIINTEAIQGFTFVEKMINGKICKTRVKNDMLNQLLDMNFGYIIVDESHRFKQFNGIRAKTLHILGDNAHTKYKTILTGSPILNDPSDIWSQYRFVAPHIFDRNFQTFRKTYFYDKNAGMPANVYFPDWQLQPSKEAELNEKIYSIAHRVTKEEVLDLPEKLNIEIDVPLSVQQKELYEQMSKQMVSILNKKEKVINPDEDLKSSLGLEDTKVMSVDLAIVKTLRLQQIVSGIFKDDITGEIIELENEANRVLKELLSDIYTDKKNKVIVWAVFQDSYKQIAKIFEQVLPKGYYFTYLTGLQSYDDKVANVDKFNSDPKCLGIIANQGAGGTGINLTAANYAIYYSRDFSLEKDMQSDARNHRGGQTRVCTRYDFVRRDTIDEHVLQALQDKRNMSNNILKVSSKSIIKDINLEKIFLGKGK